MALEVLDKHILVAGSQQKSRKREWLHLWLETAKALLSRNIACHPLINVQLAECSEKQPLLSLPLSEYLQQLSCDHARWTQWGEMPVQ